MPGSKDRQAIDTSSDFLKQADMSASEKGILADIVARVDFLPEKVIWRSNYWGSAQIGAVHYSGKYEGKPAVLKIQGVKPEISEAFMIKSFAEQNKSKVVRPPKLFFSLPWTDNRGYEALIMEHVSGSKVLQDGELKTGEQIAAFFEVYEEYKRNCLNRPWLPKSRKKLSPGQDLEILARVAKKIKPDNPFRREDDLVLAQDAVAVLSRVWAEVEPEFMHGHFSAEDLIRQKNEVVLFSNLFWKWKHPFYDAVFAYHWFIYSLAKVEGITPAMVEEQRQLWLSAMMKLPEVGHSPGNRTLLKAALLERAIAGLLVDSFAYIDEANPLAEEMVTSTRRQVQLLTEQLFDSFS